MADQHRLFDQTSRRDDRRALDEIVARRPKRRSVLRLVAGLTAALGSLSSLALFLWASLGHLVLQPRYTYAEIFGTRQGETTGAAELAAAPKKIEATNRFNRQTAGSEADKQNAVIRATTAARADQNATVSGTAISRNAPIEAAANCLRHIRAEAASRLATCIGTGVAGAECEARSALVGAVEAKCGSLELPSNNQPGVTP